MNRAGTNLIPLYVAEALKRLDKRLLDVIDQEAGRASLLAGNGASGWDGLRNLARPDSGALLATTGAAGPLAPTAPDLGFARIRRALGLDPAAADLQLLLLAPFIEPRYQSLYAMLQDDPGQPLATERLVLSVLGRGHDQRARLRNALRPGGPLLTSGFVIAVGDRHPPLRQPYTLPDEIAAALFDCSSPFVAGAAQQHWFTNELTNEGDATVGPSGSACRVFTGAGGLDDEALRHMPAGARVFLARLEPDGKDMPRQATQAAWRLGICLDAWPLLDLRDLDGETAADCAAIAMRRVAQFGGRAWFLSAAPLTTTIHHIACRPPPWTRRAALWTEAAGASGLDLGPEGARRLANRHRLGRRGIAEVLAEYRHATAGDSDDTALPYRLDAIASARTLRAPKRATWRDPRVTLDDLVLRRPTRAALERLIHFIDNRDRIDEVHRGTPHFGLDKGPIALFHGRPGTGKTMAAEAVAGALGRPLHVVDLSQLVSKYVGETEKHIDETLSEAERGGAVLFFDEADALFTRRVEKASSGGEQFSNMVVGYLLQRIEVHAGPIILATNLAQGIDEAVMRRFGFRIEFPLPDAHERTLIWTKMLAGSCLGAVDLAHLGQVHRLAGGEIRNAAMKAIFLADMRAVAIDQCLLDEAVRLELYELGRLSRTDGGDATSDRGLVLRTAGNRLQDLLEGHLRGLFLNEIHVIEGPPTERNLSGYRPALSLAMFRLAGRRAAERGREGDGLRVGFVLSAWSARADEEHEILGVVHAFLASGLCLESSGRALSLRLQESHDFELLQRFWTSHDQPMKPSIVLELEID